MKKKVNWEKIKNEYIVDTTTSYRKLAEKYGVPFNTLKRRGLKEKWVELRTQSKHKVATKIQNEVIEDNIAFYKDLQRDIKEATKVIVIKTIEIAKSIDSNDVFGEKRLNKCQKTIESAVNTLDKICFPQHETQDNNITVVLGDAEEYAE